MPALDRLRGYYLHSPRWVQSGGGRLLSVVPPRILYGRTFRGLQADLDRARRDASFVERHVQATLRVMLTRARTTPYYGELLEHIDVRSATTADLARLPILTRDTVRRETERMLCVSKSRLDEARTSGTSQASLSVYLDRDRSVKEWAFVTDVWSRCGYRLTDRRAVLRHGHDDFHSIRAKYWLWEPGTRELRLSPLRMVPNVMDEYLELLRRFRIAYVHGYPSAISLLAAHAARVGWSVPATLKGVLPISESLLPHQRATIREGFGPLAIQPFYGLTEKVAFAGEITDDPGDYEFEPLYGLAEVVDAGGHHLGPGQRGRLIGTGFISTGMPLIRYDTGDLATVVELPSAGNCWRLRARDLVSAYAQDYLVTDEGGLVPATAMPTSIGLVREYQYVQSAAGHATLRVVPEDGVTLAQLEPIARTIGSLTDGLMSVDIEIVDEIPTTARGKRKFVEQHLDLSAFGSADEQ
jgi:phenylacetate-CoA ligase